MAYPPRWIPDPLTFQNYVEVLTRTAVPWQILNTMLAASLAAAIVVVASSLAGYGFSRFDFRGKDFLLLSLLGCVMVSGATKVVPLYLMLHKVGLLNSLSGLGPRVLGGVPADQRVADEELRGHHPRRAGRGGVGGRLLAAPDVRPDRLPAEPAGA